MFPYVELTSFTLMYFAIGWMLPAIVPDLQTSQHKEKKKNDKDKENYNSCQVAFIHSTTCLILCIFAIFTEGIQVCGENTLLSKMIVTHSLGYFIRDTIMGEVKKYNEPGVIIHHLLSVITLGPALYLNYGANQAIIGLLGAELTNPLQQMRVILKLRQITYTKQYSIICLLFGVLWVLIRGIMMVPFIFMNYLCMEAPLLLSLGGSFLAIYSSYYTIIILHILQGMYTQKEGGNKVISKCCSVINAIYGTVKGRILFHGFYVFGVTIVPLSIWLFKYSLCV